MSRHEPRLASTVTEQKSALEGIWRREPRAATDFKNAAQYLVQASAIAYHVLESAIPP